MRIEWNDTGTDQWQQRQYEFPPGQGDIIS